MTAIDLDAIKARHKESAHVFAAAQDLRICHCSEDRRDLIDEVERLRADATRAEADLTEDCTRLMRERDEARAEVERLRGSSEHEAMLAAYLDAADNAGWGTR